MSKFTELRDSFGEAIERLREVLQLDKNSIVRDSAIKRFEFVFDLSWKTLKAHLEESGLDCASPKTCFQEGFRQGLISDESAWLNILEMRNETVHSYEEDVAERVYEDLPVALGAYEQLFAELQKK